MLGDPPFGSPYEGAVLFPGLVCCACFFLIRFKCAQGLQSALLCTCGAYRSLADVRRLSVCASWVLLDGKWFQSAQPDLGLGLRVLHSELNHEWLVKHRSPGNWPDRHKHCPTLGGARRAQRALLPSAAFSCFSFCFCLSSSSACN